MMEMYAETNSRGGVIEPPGVVEIKFRTPKLLATMERLDPDYKALKDHLSTCSPHEKQDIKTQIEQKEKQLFSVYQQAAVSFADLHDRPGRMLAKEVIKRIIPWHQSRTYFYWRLLRRVCELDVTKSMQAADPNLSFSKAREQLVSWFIDDLRYSNSLSHTPEDQKAAFEESDIEVVRWINDYRPGIDCNIESIRNQHLSRVAHDLVEQSPQLIAQQLALKLANMDEKSKRVILDALL